MQRSAAVLPLLVLAACASDPAPPEPTPAVTPAVTSTAAEARSAPTDVAAAAKRTLPFDPSPEDRPALGTGLVGARAVPAETGYSVGVPVAGLQETGAVAKAGMRSGDAIVELAGSRFDGPLEGGVQRLRQRLETLAPDTSVPLVYWRKGTGIVRIDLRLGRSPPPFARLSTPEDWFVPRADASATAPWVDAALGLDGGRERFADVLARHRKAFSKRDPLRLRRCVEAQLNPWAQPELARSVTRTLRDRTTGAAWLAAGQPVPPRVALDAGQTGTLDAELSRIESFVVDADRRMRDALARWSPEERTWVAEHFVRLTERIAMGEYLSGDEDVEREYTNRRLMRLLESVDRAAIARVAEDVTRFTEETILRLSEVVPADAARGLLAERDTAVGRIEIWGSGGQRHTKRCAFRFDRSGDDNYLDVAGRADLSQPISIHVDMAGDDLYGASAPFCQGAALGGIGLLVDREGDDQYLAKQWGQGAAVAGFGMLWDGAGRDTYRGLDMCQGVALVGAGSLHDAEGADTYSGQRFCQGVGFAAGVGALVDRAGDDRYACTGRYDSEYGEAGLFSGWGQGVGFGFRRVTSGGIGALYDEAGDDVYEAGNFSQGGAYFYAWGILQDDAGADRYLGSRYAQGYAAHQAAGTFLDAAGDDHYQSHSSVAQGLSWDETSVLFWDGAGDDVYDTRGFSLASAAHNGMVIFVDESGDDTYAALPAKANSNGYHGGHSFALFLDLGGTDTYGTQVDPTWNDRVFWRHDGAYHLDLPAPDADLRALIRADREP